MESVKERNTWVKWFNIYFQNFFKNSLLKVNLVYYKFHENCVDTKIDFKCVFYINCGIYELQHEVINLA